MNISRLPSDPDERDALAGEYVLGTLDARTVAAVRAAVTEDAALRAAVAAWEERLAPLAGLAPQAAPPPELWERIAAGLPTEARRAPVRAAAAGGGTLRRTVAIWRAWAIGTSLAAAALAGVAVVQSGENRRLEARLQEAAPATQLAVQPSQPAGGPTVRQATSGDGRESAVRPAAADAAVAQPSGAQAQGAPIAPAPQQSAPGAVVQARPDGTAVQPATGSDGGTIRR